MSDVYAAVNGQRLASLKLTVAGKGPWVAICEFEEAPKLSGRVTLQIGDKLKLSGTVDLKHDGTFGQQKRCRIVAGAGRWGETTSAKDYHNDAGVKARSIADDVARAVGETIGTFVPTAERVGNHYACTSTVAASRVLEDVAGGANWYVDFSGVTHVGPRTTTTLRNEDYEVLAFEPNTKVVTLSCEDPAKLVVGAMLSDRLDAPVTVRDYELTINASELRITAWCGDTSEGRLPGLLRAIVERIDSRRLFGCYRYRVVSMTADRYNLQAVRKGAGLPDVLPISAWPGVGGLHTKPASGSECLVEFIEGDRTMPIVTHFQGKDGDGFTPLELAFGGGDRPIARVGDTVDVFFPPIVPFQGTYNGGPIAGVMQLATQGVGIINTGRDEFKA